jgi:glucose dehydrogenase
VKGAQVYAAHCATCHGPNGTNIGTVNLSQGRFRLATSDDDLKRLIGTGIPAAGMPPIALVYPGVQGGTNWYSPSYSPRTRLLYVPIWENNGAVIRRQEVQYTAGRPFTGGGWSTATPVPNAPGTPALRRGPFNTWTEATGTGAVLAIDPHTGDPKWKFPMTDVTDSGILTTGSDLLFTGGREGYFQALDARTGALLWKANLGGQIVSGPMSYQVGGKQYVSVIAGLSLVTFALRD